MSKKNYVLVTGGLGFIGSHVVVKLIENDVNVLIVDNLWNSKIEVLDSLLKITQEKRELNKCDIVFVKGDIRDEDSLINLFGLYEIIVVMHFAALKSVGESQKYPELYHDVNVNGTKVLLNVMNKFLCDKFIYSSSATVYGDSESPVTEDSVTGHGLSCNYAVNKYDVERYIQEIYKDYSLKVVMLRYFNPIGAHKSGLIGENPVGVPNNIFPYLLRVAIKANSDRDQVKSDSYDSFTIFGNDYETRDGTCIRDYIHVEDLALSHIYALNMLLKSDESKIHTYNVGTGKGSTVLELLDTLNDVLKSHNKILIKYRIGMRRDGDLKECYANSNKIYEELGFKTQHGIRRMCEDGLRYAKVIKN